MERKFAILIVDDNVNLALNLQHTLEAEGYRSTVAYDGQTAINLCREKVFDLAIIDIKLPDIAGIKLIQNLTELSSHIEYIISTGYASLDSAIEAVGRRNIVAYETKPLDMDHLLALITQVAERKRAEERVVKYEELDRLKSNLLSTVSHELRTPLAIIKGYSTMLIDYEQRLTTEEKHDYLQSIDSATDRLTELVDHLLDLSRMEAGLLKLNKQPTCILRLMEKSVAEARLRAPGHEIVLKSTEKLPTMNIDTRRIRQVVDNIIDNAIKYSEEGTKVVLETRPSLSELQIRITDEGVGIPAEDLEKVFDRMYRIEQKLDPEIGGIGLGLAICRGLVEAHGGKIWAESNPEKGSTFCFTLPIETDTEEPGYGQDT